MLDIDHEAEAHKQGQDRQRAAYHELPGAVAAFRERERTIHRLPRCRRSPGNLRKRAVVEDGVREKESRLGAMASASAFASSFVSQARSVVHRPPRQDCTS